MTIKALFDNVFKIALLAAVAYGIWYWQAMDGEGDVSTTHAERACRDAINARFDLTRVNVFEVTGNSAGYTVKASGTLRNGGTARLVCLASRNGSVRDVSIEHH